MTMDDRLSLASARLDDIRAHVQLLAADADKQNAWLHPCGWTRQEPYEHVLQHPPCMPIGELYDSFDDMWPMWRSVLEPVLTAEIEAALDALKSRLAAFFAVPYLDEVETLDSNEWAVVRRCAQTTLSGICAKDP